MYPILFQFHRINLYSYGLFVAAAMVMSLILAERRAGRFGFEPGMVADILFVLFLAGILGARILYVSQNFEDYRGDLWAIFRVQEGGLVWYGGLFGAMFCGALYARWRHCRF